LGFSVETFPAGFPVFEVEFDPAFPDCISFSFSVRPQNEKTKNIRLRVRRAFIYGLRGFSKSKLLSPQNDTKANAVSGRKPVHIRDLKKTISFFARRHLSIVQNLDNFPHRVNKID
jgi:hypothetical protein